MLTNRLQMYVSEYPDQFNCRLSSGNEAMRTMIRVRKGGK